LAGRMTFTDELERYILPVRFRLLPNDAVLATTLEELVVRVFFFFLRRKGTFCYRIVDRFVFDRVSLL
jgi:hypothetical protein